MNQLIICLIFLVACLLAVIGVLLFVWQYSRQYKRPKAKRVNRLTEFSKRTIVALTTMWFIGAVIGIVVVTLQVARGDYTNGLSDLLLYINAPMTGGIVAYLLKSAYENREKIKKSEVHKYAEYENEVDKP